MNVIRPSYLLVLNHNLVHLEEKWMVNCNNIDPKADIQRIFATPVRWVFVLDNKLINHITMNLPSSNILLEDKGRVYSLVRTINIR